MSSQRQLIRAKIVDLLLGSTDAGKSVFGNRIIPIWATELPIVCVFTKSETAAVYNEAPLIYQRKLKVAIEIAVSSANGSDEQLDQIADQIESLMAVDYTLGGLCRDVLYQQTDIDFLDDGKDPVAVCKLSFEITYYSDGAPPFDGLRDFAIADAKINIDPGQPTIDEAVNIPTS